MSMKNETTRSQIKALGKKLRHIKSDDALYDDDLAVLNWWRSHHEPSLRYYANFLKRQALDLGLTHNQFTVIHRIKRIQSIILKLKRYPTMQLSTMDDVAGLRIVLPSIEDVYQLTNKLKEKTTRNEILKISNYISRPKDDGYRSTHIVYRINKSPTVQMEIQLRSSLQHIWATGVEVFGTLERTSFKTGEGSENWKTFFRLLSSRFAIKEGSPINQEHELFSISQLNEKLTTLIRTLNVIEQLSAYTSIYSSNWRENRAKGRSGKYALLTLDATCHTTNVQIYPESKYSEALDAYSAIEKIHHSSQEINVVLVNLDNIENLERAYPNYFMDTKLLSQTLSKIVLGKF